MSQFLRFLGAARGCADFRDPTAVFRFKNTVKKADSLSHLAIEVPGSHGKEHMKWVKLKNPHMVNTDYIFPSQTSKLSKG
jgi:hypothetical protein